MTTSTPSAFAASFPAGTIQPRGICRDWLCRRCSRLLGKRVDGRLHLRTSRGAEYFVALPASTVCRCGTLNELPGPSST